MSDGTHNTHNTVRRRPDHQMAAHTDQDTTPSQKRADKNTSNKKRRQYDAAVIQENQHQ